MKKNITINLCGRLFNIDEDAYELLRNYIDTLRNYFARQEGGNEIADDLEERIAELLDELKSQGVEAINIDHVKEVVRRVGQPEEMEGETASPDTASPDPSEGRGATNAAFVAGDGNQGGEGAQGSEGAQGGEGNQNGEGAQNEESGRRGSFDDFFDQLGTYLREFFREYRFYRNPKDKMLAGVISGLASTFEVEATQLRLAVVAVVVALSLLGSMFGSHHWLVLFNFNVCLVFALIYAILAFIMPVAETPEQQLKMQGKPVNMQNLAEEVVQNVSEKVDKVKRSSGSKSILNGILKFFAVCFKAIMVLLALALFFGGVALLLMAVFAIYSPDTMSQFFAWNMEPILGVHLRLFVAFLVALLATLLIPAYAIIQHLVRPLRVGQRLLLLLVWIVALATAIVTGAMLDQVNTKYWYEQRESENVSMNEETVTDEGVTMKLWEKDFLATHGWTILKGEGCNDRFTARGEYYMDGRSQTRYLDCYDDHHRQLYRAEKGESLMPGRYKLTCAVRANGRGAFAYTLIDGQKTLQEIPVTGNLGGGIWKEAIDSLERVNPIQNEDEKLRRMPELNFYKALARANDGKGYGWTRLTFSPIIITKPHTVVNYGVTTDPDFTGQSWLGQWFSACDFLIEREE